MGLTSWFMGDENPFAQYVADNRNKIHGAFAGLGQGNTFSQGLGQAALYARQGGMVDDIARDQREAEAKAEEMRARYADMLSGWGGEYSDLAEAVRAGGLDPAQGYLTAWQRRYAPQGSNLMSVGGHLYDQSTGQWISPPSAPGGDPTAPSNIREWQYFSQLSPEDQSRYLIMKRSNSPLDVGTGFVTQDPANPGNILGQAIPIDNRGAAYATGYGSVEGKTDAENDALAQSIQSKLPGLRSVIDQLTALADTATYTQLGVAADTMRRELGLPVGQGAIDRASYIAIVDNQVLPLLRDTFGAAFTKAEGDSLRATLGDPNKSPEEKKAILNAFIEQKVRDVQAMQSNPRGGSSGGGTPDPLGIR